MPIRDHFRAPVESQHSWVEPHGMWPAVIVQQIFPPLPEGHIAAPGVRCGAASEIDVSAYEQGDPAPREQIGDANGGVAVMARTTPEATLTLETELPDQDEYEVRMYDARHGRRLVAAIEPAASATKASSQARPRLVLSSPPSGLRQESRSRRCRASARPCSWECLQAVRVAATGPGRKSP